MMSMSQKIKERMNGCVVLQLPMGQEKSAVGHEWHTKTGADAFEGPVDLFLKNSRTYRFVPWAKNLAHAS